MCIRLVCTKAEIKIAESSLDKEYSPIGGGARFCELSAELAFGTDSSVITGSRVSLLYHTLECHSAEHDYS